jgi:hypothetical protein
LAISDPALEAITEVLNAMVMQMVDMNTTLSQFHNRMLVENSYLGGIVDELRILNSAAGRIEDQISYRP